MNSLIQIINPGHIEIILNESNVKLSSKKYGISNYENIPFFYSGDDISGSVKVNLPLHRKPLKFSSISIELHGKIYMDDSYSEEFLYISQQISDAGVIEKSTCIPFHFKNMNFKYESFEGSILNIKYFLKAVLVKSLNNLTCKKDIHILLCIANQLPSVRKHSVVGYVGTIKVSFDFDKDCYELSDVISGEVTFLVIDTKIKSTEIILTQNEIIKDSYYIDDYVPDVSTTNIFEWQIAEGNPVREVTIPFKLFLKYIKIVPTMENIEKNYNVTYTLKLIVDDIYDRRYFVVNPIKFYRIRD